jgi:hypothetical protein
MTEYLDVSAPQWRALTPESAFIFVSLDPRVAS